MKDVNFTRLIMPAVNLTKGKPHVFRSRHLPKAIHDSDIKIADAIIASTAAPTYFPHRQIGENSYVDGGMWAADPSMLAVAEALRINELTDVSHPEEHFKTVICTCFQLALVDPSLRWIRRGIGLDCSTGLHVWQT